MEDNKKNNKNKSLSDASVSIPKFSLWKNKKKDIKQSTDSIKSVSNYVISKNNHNDEKTLEVENSVSDRIRENVKNSIDQDLLDDIKIKKDYIENLKQKIISKRTNEKVNQTKTLNNSSSTAKYDIKELFNKYDIEQTAEKVVKQENFNHVPSQTRGRFYHSSNNLNTANIQRKNSVSLQSSTSETPLISEYADDIFKNKEADYIINEIFTKRIKNGYFFRKRSNFTTI